MMGIMVNTGSGVKRSASGSGGSCRVFVRGFDIGTTDEQLDAHMSVVGTIEKVKWFTKSSAEISYSSSHEAAAAVAELSNSVIEGNSRFIDVLAQADDSRPAKQFKTGGKGQWNLAQPFESFHGGGKCNDYGGGCGLQGGDWGGMGGGDWGNMMTMMMGPKLVEKIKAFQRSGEEQKQAWYDFCDNQPGRDRDPARYPVDILMRFVWNNRMQGSQGNSKQKFGTSDHIKEELVAQIKGFQRSGEEQKQAWYAFCDGQQGKKDPATYTVDILQGFAQDNGIQGLQGNSALRFSTSDYIKEELVAQIKGFQRSGEEQKQAWYAFCDGQPGRKDRDPARYEADILQSFVQDNGIQGLQGNSKQTFSTSDYIKDELVAQIKGFQRSGEEQKQAWYSFCDGQPGKQDRDPARYEVDILQGFVQEHGIQGILGDETQKAELVAKIKSFQKSGEEQKQTWYTFCESQITKKRDPSLHLFATLQGFVQANGI